MDARQLTSFMRCAIALSLALSLCTHQFASAQILGNRPMMVLPQGMPVVMGQPRMAMPTAASAQSVAAPSQKRRGQAVAQSENFIVFANEQTWAEQVVQTAETQRRELAMHWLGQELPPWSARCPIHVHDAPSLGAGGETRFVVQTGIAGDWQMTVQGTRERILDSVLPHEISHTIFATYFGKLNKYVPRWADEGAATTVEHEAEKSKHRYYLRQFLQTGRGLAFNNMFQMKEYPKDILPLYAQGHSAVQFLIDQEDAQHFVRFLEQGMQTENWTAALQSHFQYDSIGEFQTQWNKWLLDGSPKDLLAYSPRLQERQNTDVALASATLPAKQSAAGPAIGVLPSDPVSIDLLPSYIAADQTINSAPGESDSMISMDEAIASQATATPAPVASLAAEQSAATVSNGSWYEFKLRQTSGRPATPIPQHNHFSGSGNLRSAQPVNSPANATAVARPQPAQTPVVQVLDWGPAMRFSGLPSDNPAAPHLR